MLSQMGKMDPGRRLRLEWQRWHCRMWAAQESKLQKPSQPVGPRLRRVSFAGEKYIIQVNYRLPVCSQQRALGTLLPQGDASPAGPSAESCRATSGFSLHLSCFELQWCLSPASPEFT